MLVIVLPGGFDMELIEQWQREPIPCHNVYPETFMRHHNGNGNGNEYGNRTELILTHPDS